MLEWYRAGAPHTALMEDCTALLRLAAETAGIDCFVYRGRRMNPHAEPERLTLAEAFDRFAGIDLLATVAPGGETDRDAFAEAVAGAGLRVAPDDTWADLFSRVLVARIEPHLGIGRPTILHAYPVSEAALARPAAHDPRVAERFELYACGVELANAFGELTDPAEQRRRFELEMAEKLRVYGERYPIDEEFLAALAVMPEASGIAPGLRPARDAGLRGEPHRRRDLDPGRGDPAVKPRAAQRRRSRRRRAGLGGRGRGPARRARPLRRVDHARHGRADRSGRSGRPDRPTVHPQRPGMHHHNPRSTPIRSATPPMRR